MKLRTRLSKPPPSMDMGLTSSSVFLEKGRAGEKLRGKLAADGFEKFQKAQNERWKQERQWYLNMAFYFGNHYVQFRQPAGSSNFDMHVPPAPYYRARPVINQIRRVIRTDISRLTSQKPNAMVMPASSEDRDVFAAQAGEQIWDSVWRQQKLNQKIRQAVFWQTVCGNGFLKQFWDSVAIDPINSTPDRKVYGDIVVNAETPFHVFVPDIREESLEGQPYMIHAQVRNREWVRKIFKVDVMDNNMTSVEDSMNNVMGISERSRENVLILEIWVKPGCIPELPNGGMYMIANSQILHGVEGWPYTHNKFPFSKLDAIPTGKFYTDSIIVDLIPLQKELNRTRGQIIEAKNRTAKPQLVAEEGSVNAAGITTEPGQVIIYKAGHEPPQPLPLQNLPAYVTEEVNRIYTDIADLSGQHEVSQGSAPPGVTAAVAISFLQEKDESLLTPFFHSIEDAIEVTAAQCLCYVKDYWDEERSIRIVGTDKTFDVQTFKGSDLRDNTDIRVEGGSALPTSRAAKQAFIMDMMKMGFVDPKEGLQVLEMGGLAKIYENVQIDIRQAQRENLRMSVATKEHMEAYITQWQQETPPELQKDTQSGLQLNAPLIVPVNNWDNHQIHIEQHNRYRKSQSFDMLPREAKMLFDEHVKQHMEAALIGVTAGIPPGMDNPLGSQSSQSGMEQPPPPTEGMESPSVSEYDVSSTIS